MQETSVQVTEGKEVKEKIGVLINELVKIVEGKVAEFNITDAIPAFITNVDRRWRTSEIAE
jgi:DNA helicase TIP49 (TBP-interacting protein)